MVFLNYTFLAFIRYKSIKKQIILHKLVAIFKSFASRFEYFSTINEYNHKSIMDKLRDKVKNRIDSTFYNDSETI